MKTARKIILIVLSFLLCLKGIDLIINLVMETIYENCYVGQTGGKINYYLRKRPLPDILIMGDSRAFYMVDPDSFKVLKGFNIGHAGVDQSFQTGLLSVLIHKNKVPKRVLLHIEPDFFLRHDTGRFTSKDIQQLKYYYGKDPVVTDYLNQLSYFEPVKFLFKSYRFNGRVFNTLINYAQTRKNPEATGNGFVQLAPTSLDSLHTEYTSNYYPKDTVYFNPTTVRYLLDFLKMANDHHIQVDCFTSPNYFKQRKDYFKPARVFLDSLFQAKGIRYIDYQRFPPTDERFKDPTYWVDSWHLNKKGAAVFSQTVAKDFLY